MLGLGQAAQAEPAVDADALAGDEARLVAQQKGDAPGHVLGIAQPPERGLADEARSHHRVVGERGGVVGGDQAGQDRVDPDPEVTELIGGDSGEHVDARLGGRVGPLPAISVNPAMAENSRIPTQALIDTTTRMTTMSNSAIRISNMKTSLYLYCRNWNTTGGRSDLSRKRKALLWERAVQKSASRPTSRIAVSATCWRAATEAPQARERGGETWWT